MRILQRYKVTALGILLGLVAGYLYYHFIGCASGRCAITSNPINSTLYGAMLGGLFMNTFEKKLPQTITFMFLPHIVKAMLVV